MLKSARTLEARSMTVIGLLLMMETMLYLVWDDAGEKAKYKDGVKSKCPLGLGHAMN